MRMDFGSVDRAINIVLGLAILTGVMVGPQTPLGLIGLVPLVSGLMGWSPAYGLLNCKTAEIDDRGQRAAEPAFAAGR